MSVVRVFAPASVGNVGPGFDVLGMAITGVGDTVEACFTPGNGADGVTIDAIHGDGGALPLNAADNTAGIAAADVLQMARARRVAHAERGVTLTIHKGVPGTGLGSSAASAVAGAYAVNALLALPFSKEELLPACIRGEGHVSGGIFLDNLAASLLGGVVTCHTAQTAAWRVGAPTDVHVVVATPKAGVLTRTARGSLADTVPQTAFVHNMGAACAMVAAAARGDGEAFARAIDDRAIEPQRAGLIPGFAAVKAAALAAGALGCSISGAGASVFAVSTDPDRCDAIGQAMVRAFAAAGGEAAFISSQIDAEGVRILPS